MVQDIGAAIREFTLCLGAEHVLSDKRTLESYANNVTGLLQTVPLVLKPGSTKDVVEVVAIANRHKVPLYPLSSGKNWGLGSRLPPRAGTVVVDLGRMNRILEINEKHHYAVVEPGVTQRQLHEEITRRKIPYIMNVIGSGLDTSLVGNALERGIGYFASRAGMLSGLEVVLGNGRIVRTGFGHYDNAKNTHIYKHGVGPALDGLFYQSNYGIVTRAGIELLPWHGEHLSAIIKIDDEAKLQRLVDALADLRRREIVRMVVHIGNRHRTIGTLAPLVYETLPEDVRRDVPKARATAEAMLAEEGFGPWSAVASLSGTREQVALARREIKAACGGFAQCVFLNDEKIATAKKLLDLLSFLPGARRKRAIVRAMEPVYGLSNGIPTNEAIKSVYWAAGELPPNGPLDPDQSPCGLLYCLPMIPLDGSIARASMDRIDAAFQRYGFKPMATLNIIDERCIEIVLSTPFRKDDPEQVRKAHACVEELDRAFMEEGYYPYRLSVNQMGLVVREGDTFWETVRDLKQVLDPNGIIAPGRYNLI